tara:strand:- start:574 stop:1386 length:813 start_codon:yes stop_codon:yes gene_type:complete
MAQVTGGKVTYTRRVQAAQFEPKEATVELAFAFSEGEKNFEDFLDQVANSAIGKVHAMIGVAQPAVTKPKSDPLRPANPVPAEEIHGIGATTLDLTGRIDMGATMAAPEPERTKADLAAEKIAEVSDPANLADGPAPRRKPGRPPRVAQPVSDPAALSAPLEDTAGDKSDPAALGDTVVANGEAPLIVGEVVEQAGSDPSSLGDVEDWEAEAPALTDAEVQAKIAATNTRIQNPTAIKQMIYKFAGDPPKTFRDIPAEVRPQFVKELEAL